MVENEKNQNSSVIDLNRLEQFIHRISGTRETPALIQIVAGSGEWMELTRELVNTAPENDPELWRQFSRACQRKKLDPDKLRARLVPVARSLGLSVYDNQQQDYYTILGIDSSTSPEEIRKAYHRKAKSLHPDTRKSGGDDQAFIQLADGYQILKDPVLRAHYDQSRQSMEAWCEGPECIDENRDEAGHKSRRNRYILQMSGVVVLMIFVGLIFNVIYESRAINDGFYTAPEPEKTVSDPGAKGKSSNQNESEIVKEGQEADRVVDRLKQDETKGESAASVLSERATSIPSVSIDKKPNRVSTGISNLDRKQMAQSNPMVSMDEKARSVASNNIEIKDKEAINKGAEVKPEIEAGGVSLTKQKKTKAEKNTDDSLRTEQRDVVPQAQAGTVAKVEEKPIANVEATPEIKKRVPSIIKQTGIQTTDNTEDYSTTVRGDAVPPAQTGLEMKAAKNMVESKLPPVQEKNREENDPALNRQIAALDLDQDTAHKASELLRKFAKEDGEIKGINAFIRVYSETYVKKDYSEFSRLFTEDATENGKAFSELAPDYRRTFTAIEKLEYEIKLYRTSLLVDQEVIRTEGIYKIAWQPYDGMRKESEGPISFEIVKRKGQYRVKKLKYGKIKPK